MQSLLIITGTKVSPNVKNGQVSVICNCTMPHENAKLVAYHGNMQAPMLTTYSVRTLFKAKLSR